MTSLELFRALGGVSTENLAGADRLQRMQEVPVRRRRSVKQAALIAAVIALLMLLVGCAAVYVLHLQDLKVDEYRTIPTPVYDENGDVVPVGTHPLRTEISLQGVNQDALKEWSSFLREYDKDAEIAIAYDNGSEDTGIPEAYYISYGCYSWDMVNKLDEIAKKYGLKLLSTEVTSQSYESETFLSALGVDPLYQEKAEYLNGIFYPEGTFDFSLLFQLDGEDWPYEDNCAQYHYSLKSFFDPKGGVITDFADCIQWNYTRKDGKELLLAMNGEQAWIFADRADAFISISFASSKWDNGVKQQMSQELLEKITERFNLDITPRTVDMGQIETLRAEAKRAYDAQREESIQQMYAKGYEAHIQHQLDTALNDRQRDSLYYSLYDLNGDGVDELLSGGKGIVQNILSLRDGVSYSYCDFDDLNLFGIWRITVCEGNILALKDALSGEYYVFLRADAEGLTYLEGLRKKDDTWYSIPEQPPASPENPKTVEISSEQAKAIQDSYVPVDNQPQWQLMKRYGEPVKTISWTDPYSQYIADCLDRLTDADKLTYALMDLNGDGVKELITKDILVHPSGNRAPEYRYAVYTIVDGERVTLQEVPLTGFCEGGIAMWCDEQESYYAFYRMNGTKLEEVERIWKDRVDLYWTRFLDDDPNPQPVAFSEEKAREYINAYKPITLDMKPFSEYPLH